MKDGTLVELKGSEKQIAWANQIREDALRNGLKIEVANCSCMANAKSWIDQKMFDRSTKTLVRNLNKCYDQGQLDREESSQLPELRGSEKQVAWANRIRRELIESGMNYGAAAEISDAKFWISHRTCNPVTLGQLIFSL